MPLDGLGYLLKSPGMLIHALSKKIKPSTVENLGENLLRAYENKIEPLTSILTQLERDGGALLTKLMASRPMGNSEEDVKKQVLIGEHLVAQIMGGFGNDVSLPASSESVIAISWYLLAKSVATTRESFKSGTINLVDPDHRLARFMASAPTCHGRISTHFSGRSLSPKGLWSRLTQAGLPSAFSKSPVQYGIEDFSMRTSLPNGKRAILFDMLASPSQDSSNNITVPQTMIRFEDFGMPTACRLFGHDESTWDIPGKLGNAILSLSHCVQHALNFAKTRFESNRGEGHFREHFSKDIVKREVVQPFEAFIKRIKSDTDAEKIFLEASKEVLAKKDLDTLLKFLNEAIKKHTDSGLSNGEIQELTSIVEKGNHLSLKRGEAVYQDVPVKIRQGGEIILSISREELAQARQLFVPVHQGGIVLMPIV